MNRTIDSERILRLVQLEIAEKNNMLNKVDFDDLCTSESLPRIRQQKRYSRIRCAHWLKEAQDSAVIEWVRPIEGNFLYVLIKKAVRTCLAFLVNPMVERQNAANRTMVGLLEQLFRYTRERDHHIVKHLQEMQEKVAGQAK